jgi:DNA mismatch repair protein MutS
LAKKETPLMKQYNATKAKYPDALLLFRVGDFYETFGEDAVRASKILDIILTKRGAGSETETELAGFPHHSLNTYLPKLSDAIPCIARLNNFFICHEISSERKSKKAVRKTRRWSTVLRVRDQKSISELRLSTLRTPPC